MGYGEIDQLAINTIRLLAVRAPLLYPALSCFAPHSQLFATICPAIKLLPRHPAMMPFASLRTGFDVAIAESFAMAERQLDAFC
jgi:hypothetical protein